MDYHKIYNEFIHDRILREHELEGQYSETHHIVPSSLDGPNEWLNLVKLSPSDHIFAHLLLAKIFGGPMDKALCLMIGMKKYKGRATRKIYLHAKIAYSKQLSEMYKGEGNPFFGKKHNGKLAGENNPFYGRKHSKETKEIKSITMKGKKHPMSNKATKALIERNKKPVSEETREKRRVNATGKKQTAETIEKRLLKVRGRKRPPPTEETKAKMRIAQLGNKHCLGHKHTEETLEKLRGKNNPMYGRTGENHPNYGKTGENHPNYGKTKLSKNDMLEITRQYLSKEHSLIYLTQQYNISKNTITKYIKICDTSKYTEIDW